MDEWWSDHGDKRFTLFALPAVGNQGARCAPPVIGYIDLIEGAALPAGAVVGGWAVAGGTGVAELRLRIDDRLPQPVGRPHPLPSLVAILGDTGDPRMPRVGWRAELPAALPPGRHWLTLEARTAERPWHPVTALPLDVSAKGD